MSGRFTYEIRIRGVLDPGWAEGLGLRLQRAGDRSVLTGPMDQAALHGALRQLADLGVTLESVLLRPSRTPGGGRRGG